MILFDKSAANASKLVPSCMTQLGRLVVLLERETDVLRESWGVEGRFVVLLEADAVAVVSIDCMSSWRTSTRLES